MNDYLKKKLIDIVDSLISWPICNQFIGSTSDTLCGKFDILAVRETTNLNTIKNHLECGKYKTLDEFVKEVNLMWDSSIKNKNPDNLQKIMAEEAKYWFNNKMKHFPTSKKEEWVYKNAKYTRELNELLSFCPLGKAPTAEEIAKACEGLTMP